MTVTHISDNVDGNRVMIANTQLDFRATTSQIQLDEQNKYCTLSKETAEILKVKCGDSVLVVKDDLKQ